MNKELLEALDLLEKEKNISKDTLLEAIENSLLTACKNHFGKADNVRVIINKDTCDFSVYAEKEVVEEVEDPLMQISLAEAKMMDVKYDLGDIVQIPIKSKEFGRIATQNAKNVILQKIREEERKVPVSYTHLDVYKRQLNGFDQDLQGDPGYRNAAHVPYQCGGRPVHRTQGEPV